MRIAVINGPNLNLLGVREPEIYGSTTLAQVENQLASVGRDLGVDIECSQNNSEGALVDVVQGLRGRVDGAIVNAGAYSHTSLAIRDALVGIGVPFVEVHVSNIYAREPERRHSMLASAAIGVVVGLGIEGYALALRGLVAALQCASREVSDLRPRRIASLVDAISAAHLDGLLLTGLANIRYLTGFSGSSALVVVTARDVVFITDFRYQSQIAEEVGDLARVVIEPTSLWTGLWQQLATLSSVKVVGFESAHIQHRDFQRLIEAGARWQWRPTSDLVETLRERKDACEIALIERAAAVASRALARTLPEVRVGQTELEVAGVLEKALRDEGSEGFPFPSIVASGPRSALPHARSSPRTIEEGEFLLMDFGAEVSGYCSDMTRTVVVGRASEEHRAIYDVVRSANEKAATGVRAGMLGRDADAIARQYIDRAGFGELFGHSLGHGIGLEVHEAPRLARTADGMLPVGAVVTIEPGIYRPGWGGVRIEDDVVLGADGPQILTQFSRELIELA